MATKSLTAIEARELALAEHEASELKLQLEEAERVRDDLRDRLHGRLGRVKDSKARASVVDGVQVRASPVAGRRLFKLADYEEAGHKLTATMRKFVETTRGYRRWTVKATPEALERARAERAARDARAQVLEAAETVRKAAA